MSAAVEIPLAELAERALERLRRADPGAQAEVFLYRGRERGLDLRFGEPELTQEAAEEGFGLRLLRDGRMAFAHAGGLKPELVVELHARARAQLPHLPPDECRVLPPPAPANAPESIERSWHDPGLFVAPLHEQLPGLRELHARALARDPRVGKVLHIGYGESFAETAIASTTGVIAGDRQTYASFGLSVIASAGAETQIGGGSRVSRFAAELDRPAAVEEAVSRTVALLDAKRLPSRRCAVLFDPTVAGDLFELLAGALCAESVQRGKSLLKGKLGRRVASDLVSFRDEPLRPKGLASGRFDDEGVPTRDKLMLERGVLRDYFYDAYTARKEGRESNGCAGRSGYKGLPGAGASNFYLEPGKLTRERLIADTPRGILVHELMGMHTADPISGELSVGVSGLAIEDGRLTHGVRGAMLSCGLLELLERVDAVADDLVFYGGVAAPTFRVADLTIA